MQEDQRGYLKVKIKSLAEEARIIRKEEKRSKGDKREGLYFHRIRVVRREARHSLLAYGFIRGRKYRQIEATCKTPPDWSEVQRMVLKYGVEGYRKGFWLRVNKKVAEEELLKRFEEWKTEV